MVTNFFDSIYSCNKKQRVLNTVIYKLHLQKLSLEFQKVTGPLEPSRDLIH